MKLNNNDDSHNSGLNLLIYNMLLDIESHPAWVCGLKHLTKFFFQFLGFVTPCVGVWIETKKSLWCGARRDVTPCVGVWIETWTFFPHEVIFVSHPAWVCGLKRFSRALSNGCVLSHPAWVCGLKPNHAFVNAWYRGSHPAWVCGLKPLV